VKVVLHCEIEGFGHTLEQEVSFRSRVAEVLIVLNGKCEYIWSFLGSRDVKCMHIYG